MSCSRWGIAALVAMMLLVLFACTSPSATKAPFTEPAGSPTWPVSTTGRSVLYYFGTPT